MLLIGRGGDRSEQQLLSIVIPAYNEEENVGRAYERLSAVVADIERLDFELIFAVDPCTDRTEEKIAALHELDPRVKMVRLSRRFGQPAATIAGLAVSRGDAAVTIDCDLQDPPELISEMVQRWREGYDVVYTQRRKRDGETLPKLIVSKIAYAVIARISDVHIPANTGDFRLTSRRVIQHLVALNESHGYIRGMVGLVGFGHTTILYDREPRLAGASKYNRLTGGVALGFDGVFGFSRYPLHLVSLFGMIASIISFIVAFGYLIAKLAGVNFASGNATIVIAVCLFSSVQLLGIGIMGEYVGRIYDQVKMRPRYIIESEIGLDHGAGQTRASEPTQGGTAAGWRSPV